MVLKVQRFKNIESDIFEEVSTTKRLRSSTILFGK